MVFNRLDGKRKEKKRRILGRHRFSFRQPNQPLSLPELSPLVINVTKRGLIVATVGFIFTRDRTWILSDCPIVTEYNNAGASLAVSLYPVSYFASLFELLKTFRPDIPDFAIWLDFEINFSRFLFPFSHSSTTFSIFILFRNRKFWSPSSLLFLLPIQISKLRSFIFEPRNNRRSVRWIWVVIRVKNP